MQNDSTADGLLGLARADDPRPSPYVAQAGRMSTEIDVDQILRDATASVRKEYPARSEADVGSVVREELNSLLDRPVQDYLAVLTERATKQRLKRDAAQKQPGGRLLAEADPGFAEDAPIRLFDGPPLAVAHDHDEHS